MVDLSRSDPGLVGSDLSIAADLLGLLVGRVVVAVLPITDSEEAEGRVVRGFHFFGSLTKRWMVISILYGCFSSDVLRL